MRNPFREHPKSVGETYLGHMSAAFGFALRLFGASCACFVHGLMPFFFVTTGSATVKHLHQDMVTARRPRLAGLKMSLADSPVSPPPGESH